MNPFARITFIAILSVLAVPQTNAEDAVTAGDLIITGRTGTGGAVARFNPSTGQITTLGKFTLPTAAVVSTGGFLYVSEQLGGIKRLNLTNGVITAVTSSVSLSSVYGLTVDAQENLYVTSTTGNRIIKVIPATGVGSVLTSGGNLSTPIGVTMLNSSDLVVSSRNNNNIVKISTQDGSQSVIATSSNAINQPWGIAASSGKVYVGAQDSRIILSISNNVATSITTVAATPLGIAVDNADNIFVSTSGGSSGPWAIVKIDSPTNQTVFTGPSIGQIESITISPVTVTAAIQSNTPPTMPVLPNQAAYEGDPIAFAATATDTNWPLQTITFSLDPGFPSGAIITTNGDFSWIAAESQGPGNYVITIRATDNGSPVNSVSQSFTATIYEKNSVPAMSPLANMTNALGETVTFTATATDSDIPTNTLTFSLISGPTNATVSTGGVFSWTPIPTQSPSTNMIKIKVTDNGSPVLSATQSCVVVILNTVITNSPPYFTNVSNHTIYEFQQLIFNAGPNDSATTTPHLICRMNGNPPVGVSFSSSGAFYWQPTEAQGPSTNQFALVVTDNGSPPLSTTNTFEVIVQEVNSAPLLQTINGKEAYLRHPLSFDLLGTDSDLPQQVLTYYWSNELAGLNLATNGVFWWTPLPNVATPSTNRTAVWVTDDGTPAMSSAIRYFDVVVHELVLQLSQTIDGTFEDETNSILDLSTNTFLSIVSNSAGFYRLRGDQPTMITDFSLQATNVTIQFQLNP